MKLEKKHWRLVVLVLLAIASLAGGAWMVYQRTPPPMPNSVDEAMQIYKSDRFKRLPESRQSAYYARGRELFEELDQTERRRLREQYRDDPDARRVVRQAMMNFMFDRAKEFAAAEPDQRAVILDGVIAMQESGFGRRPGGGGRGGPGGRRGRESSGEESDADREQRRERRRADARQRIQNMIETGNPQRQAYISEFFKALRERRNERGLESMPGRRRGR